MLADRLLGLLWRVRQRALPHESVGAVDAAAAEPELVAELRALPRGADVDDGVDAVAHRDALELREAGDPRLAARLAVGDGAEQHAHGLHDLGLRGGACVKK